MLERSGTATQKNCEVWPFHADRAITPSDAASGWMVAGNRPWLSSRVLGCDALLFSCFLLHLRTLIWSQCIIFKVKNNVTLLRIFTSPPVLILLVLHRARLWLAFQFAGCLWFQRLSKYLRIQCALEPRLHTNSLTPSAIHEARAHTCCERMPCVFLICPGATRGACG